MNRNGSIGSAQMTLRPTFGDGVAQAARALLRWFAARWQHGAAVTASAGDPPDDLESLVELDARVLSDIGAPESLQSRARDRHDAAHRRWDEREVGFVPGDWTRW